MDQLEERLWRGSEVHRVAARQIVQLGRPPHGVVAHSPPPAPDVGQRLSRGQILVDPLERDFATEGVFVRSPRDKACCTLPEDEKSVYDRPLPGVGECRRMVVDRRGIDHADNAVVQGYYTNRKQEWQPRLIHADDHYDNEEVEVRLDQPV